MITLRDIKIINEIEKLGFVTIDQAGKLFFSEFKTQYDIARRRLKKIEEQGEYLRSFKNTETNQLIYVPYNSKLKKISKHGVLVMDYTANLKANLNVEFEKIELEKSFNNEVVADAFLQFTLADYRYYQLLEIQIRHDYVDINRYSSVMEEILKETNNTIPTLVLAQNTRHDYNKENETQLKIVQLDLSLDVAKTVI